MTANKITRRHLLGGVLSSPAALCSFADFVEVPVLRVVDSNAALTSAEVQQFNATVWDEAVRLFRSCEVALSTVDRKGEIRQYPSGRPRFLGLERNMLNVILTDSIPLDWDNGRSLSGVTTIYEGYHLSVISLKNAYSNRVPFLAVNTVLHELLHVLRGDIFVRRSGWLKGADHEAAVDWQATRLWLLGGASGVKQYAGAYVQRLQGQQVAAVDLSKK
jgi:hypothetical protein